MYVIELSLRLSPMPVAVQRRELDAAQALYGEVRQALEQGQPRVLELTCEKEEHKRVSLLSSEIVAVQIYEKSATGTGAGTGKKGKGAGTPGKKKAKVEPFPPVVMASA